jgi:hypothetical protein
MLAATPASWRLAPFPLAANAGSTSAPTGSATTAHTRSRSRNTAPKTLAHGARARCHCRHRRDLDPLVGDDLHERHTCEQVPVAAERFRRERPREHQHDDERDRALDGHRRDADERGRASSSSSRVRSRRRPRDEDPVWPEPA